MANFNQAPTLVFNGNKYQDETKQYYEIPQDLADIIFNELDRSVAALKLMLVLIGTKEGWGISEKWLLARTGMTHATYSKARKQLVEKGWITHITGPDAAIIVNFDEIYRSQEPKIDVLSEYVNNSGIESIPQFSEDVLSEYVNLESLGF